MEPKNNEKPLYTDEEIQKIADEYHAGTRRGRPPKIIAKQIRSINKKRVKLKVVKTKDNKTKVIMKKPETLDAFMEEFIKNGGNATQAALVTTKASTVRSAAELGRYYLKQAQSKGIGRLVLEKQGYDYRKLLEVAAQKMIEGKTPDWWDRLMKIADYGEFGNEKTKVSSPAVVNIVGNQNVAEDFGFATDGEVVEDETDTTEKI